MASSDEKGGGCLGIMLIAIGVITAIALTTAISVGWGLVHGRYIAPIEEQNRRLVVEESKSFRDGAIQELQNMQFEYIKATPSQQTALASIILHRASAIPAEMEMPAGLAAFLAELKAKRVKQ